MWARSVELQQLWGEPGSRRGERPPAPSSWGLSALTGLIEWASDSDPLWSNSFPKRFYRENASYFSVKGRVSRRGSGSRKSPLAVGGRGRGVSAQHCPKWQLVVPLPPPPPPPRPGIIKYNRCLEKTNPYIRGLFRKFLCLPILCVGSWK